MPNINLNMTYTVEFTAAEFRLVTLALAGKVASVKEAAEALRINERLCAQRVAQLKVASEVAAGAHEKAKAQADAAPTNEEP